jgi:hypothetical protein
MQESDPTASGDQHGSGLSVYRAFVVHLGPGGGLGRRRFRGRVEHLASGASAHFSSLDGLLAFFGSILASASAAGPRSPGDGRRPSRRSNRP